MGFFGDLGKGITNIVGSASDLVDGASGQTASELQLQQYKIQGSYLALEEQKSKNKTKIIIVTIIGLLIATAIFAFLKYRN